MIHKSLASKSNLLEESSEAIVKQPNQKDKKKPMINGSSASDDEVKYKENLLENEICDIVIEK